MGMHTELVIKADTKTDLPPIVDSVLQHLFNGANEPDALPDHAFFSCYRWSMVGRCSSYYHVPWADSKYSEGYIFSRSDLKNYDDEIELFIDWIKPYLDQMQGDCIGWSWYEESETPTLIIF